MSLRSPDVLEDEDDLEDQRHHVYVRFAAFSIAAGHLSLLLPAMAFWKERQLETRVADAYYLHPAVAAVWILGLLCDVLVFVGLRSERLEGRKGIAYVAAGLLVSTLLPWIEVVLAHGPAHVEIGASLPLPWATTHFGPVGSVAALFGAIFALREYLSTASTDGAA